MTQTLQDILVELEHVIKRHAQEIQLLYGREFDDFKERI